MAEYRKPLPQPDLETKPFWDACKRHELMVQKCTDCGTYLFYPRPMCYNCQSWNIEWVKAKGTGKVYTWVVVHQAINPAFNDEAPYPVVFVSLDEQENCRMWGNVRECNPEEIYGGMPMEVVFEDVTDEITIPHWRPIRK